MPRFVCGGGGVSIVFVRTHAWRQPLTKGKYNKNGSRQKKPSPIVFTRTPQQHYNKDERGRRASYA